MNSNYKMKAMDIKVYDIEPLDTYIGNAEIHLTQRRKIFQQCLEHLGKNTDRPIEKTVVTIDLKCQYLHFLFQIKKKIRSHGRDI